MRKDNLNNFYNWYSEFTEEFYTNDLEIQLALNRKQEHTHRVCENIREIGISLNLNENELLIAETIALFHDIGRFEQYSNHRTILDSVKDHAELGVVILEYNKILEVLSHEEKNIILKAIKYHNSYELPKMEDETVLFFCKLIRDADKLDIYKKHVTFFEEKSVEHRAILAKFPDIEEYSLSAIQAILNNKCVSDCDIKTYNDLKLTYVSWIFDISFTYTINQITKNKYIEMLIDTLPKTQDIFEVYTYVNKYMNYRLSCS